jgi:uroporphyrinogen decarboxylase
MRQAGRYLPEYREIRRSAKSFLDLCYAPELATRITLQPIERFDLDAAILFSDILVIPHALGVGVTFEDGEGPHLDAIRNAEDFRRLKPSGILGQLAPVLETVRECRRQLDGNKALIGFAGGPWTVATYMVEGGSSRDFMAVKAWAFRDPESFAHLIDLVANATAEYLVAQIKAGADAVQIFDSWAGALAPDEFLRWVVEPTRWIVEKVRVSCPGVPIIGFPRGAGALYERYVEETAVDCIGLDSSVPWEWAAKMLSPRCTVQGNLDPIALLAGGRAMLQSAERILRAFAGHPHVFNLGHGIVQQTPPAHVAELTKFVRSWQA